MSNIKKIIAVISISLVLLLVVGLFISSHRLKVTSEVIAPIKQNPTTNITSDEQKYYYGPVPEEYNQTHYWETGEMKLNGK